VPSSFHRKKKIPEKCGVSQQDNIMFLGENTLWIISKPDRMAALPFAP
jgi:hypothetical protein